MCVASLCLSFRVRWSFFFFQAEDGIRGGRVTGVQTCALPICSAFAAAASVSFTSRCRMNVAAASSVSTTRSEERRVGKECRSRRCAEAYNYNTLDFVGYPRFTATAEFLAAVLAYYVLHVSIHS